MESASGSGIATGVAAVGTVLLRVEQVAAELGVSRRTVWRLVSGGRLPRPLAIGRCRRWRRADVERFVVGLTPAGR